MIKVGETYSHKYSKDLYILKNIKRETKGYTYTVENATFHNHVPLFYADDNDFLKDFSIVPTLAVSPNYVPITFDPNGSLSSNINNLAPLKYTIHDLKPSKDILKRIYGDFVEPEVKKLSCECGAASVGSNGHSTWCCLFNKGN